MDEQTAQRAPLREAKCVKWVCRYSDEGMILLSEGKENNSGDHSAK
jgi:hypothetical protein